MKKITLLFLLLTTAYFSFSQDYFKWSQEQIITDTLSNYSNPCVIPIAYDAWMFYQKNENKSSIWKMNLTTLSDSVNILNSTTFNYTAPYFVYKNDPDYLGYIFYLSDIDGYQNLFASKYYENDSVSEPIKICKNLLQQDVSDYSLTEDGYISFVIDSLIYAADLKFYMDSVYTENEVLLDSNASNTHVKFREVAWQKQETGDSHICYSNYEYNDDIEEFYWSVPAYLDSVGNSSSLSISNSIAYWGANHFCWINNNFIKVYSGDNNYYQMDTINNFMQDNIRQISMVNWDVTVKYPYELPHYVAFTINENEESEIFSSHGEFGMQDSAHISNNSYMDENPELFFGESVDGWGTEAYYVYCIWQSHINGNIALSMAKAKAFIGSSVEENLKTVNYLKVSPNPFGNKLKIEYNTFEQNAQIQIFNISERIVTEFKNLQSGNEWGSIEWIPGAEISKGVYVVVLTVGTKQISTKVVLN